MVNAVKDESLFPQKEPCISHNPVDNDLCDQNSLPSLMQAVVIAKSKKKTEIENKRYSSIKERYSIRSANNDWVPVIITVFFLGTFILQCVKQFFAIAYTTLFAQIFTGVFSIIGGIINTASGIFCIIQGIKKLKKNEKASGLCCLYEGIIKVLVGVIIIATPIMLKFLAINALVALVCNPFLPIILSSTLMIFVIYHLLTSGTVMYGTWLGIDKDTTCIKYLSKQDVTTSEKTIKLWNTFCNSAILNEKTGAKQTYSFTDITKLIEEKEYKQAVAILTTNINNLEKKTNIDVALQVYELMITFLQHKKIQEEGENLTKILRSSQNNRHKFYVLAASADPKNCEQVVPQSHSFALDKHYATLQDVDHYYQKAQECNASITAARNELWEKEEEMKNNEHRAQDQLLCLQKLVEQKHKMQTVLWFQNLFSSLLCIATLVAAYKEITSYDFKINSGKLITNFISLYINVFFPFLRETPIRAEITEEDVNDQLA